MNLEGYTPGTVADADLRVEDRWILSRLATVTQETTAALAEYRYADAAKCFIRFRLERVLRFLRGDGQGPAERPGRAADGPAGAGPHARHALAVCCTR